MRFAWLSSIVHAPLRQGPGDVVRATMALAPPLAALGLQTLLWPTIHPYSWFLFYPAIFLSSWIGGRFGGVPATALATGLAWWFFVSPQYTFLKDGLRDYFAAMVFFSMGILFTVFNGRLRRAIQQTGHALQLAHKTNQQLQQANIKIMKLYEREKEIDELKSQFFANVSHELRTPLALILGPVEQLLAREDVGRIAGDDLRVVQRNAGTLHSYVDDLLDAAQLEAGQAKVDYADLDLAHMTRFVAGHFDVLARDRNMRYTVAVPEELHVQADPAKLQRALLNLLSNAFKFTPRHGAIRVSLRAEQGQAILEVADSGPGIPADQRNAVFGRFHQLDGGTTRRFGGIGLGLAIARDFVGLHRGTLSVADAPEGGALFVITLPQRAPVGVAVGAFAPAEGETAAVLQALDQLGPDESGLEPVRSVKSKAGRVLIVEDNLDMNRFICQNLDEEFHVETARNGEEGLCKALTGKPDLILTDIMMPGMSGEQLVREIRAHADLDDCPIVVLTAKGDDALRVKMLREGAQDYLVKPFSIEELRVRVGALIARKTAESALQLSQMQQRQLFDGAPDGIFIADLDGRYSDVNGAACRMLGYAHDELVGKTIMDLIPAGDVDRLQQSRENLLLQGAVEVREWPLRRKDGSYVLTEISANILVDGRWQAFVRDISERKRIENELQQSRSDLDRAQKLAQIGSWRIDIVHGGMRWSDETYRIFGMAIGTRISYDGFLSAVHTDDRAGVEATWTAALRGAPYDIEHRIVVDGKVKWVRERAEIAFDRDGTPLDGIGTVQDITELQRSQEQLRQATIVFDNSNDGIMLTDAATRIVAVNRAFEKMTGFSCDEIVGKTPRVLQSGLHDQAFYAGVWAALGQAGHWQGELWNRRRNGELYPVLESISAVKDKQGNITHYVSVLSDISAIKQAEERLGHLARHDALTGLPNRLLFRENLENSLSRAKRHGGRVALLFLDIDRFKLINDTLGHAAGDRLLQEIGARLRRCVRAEDQVARLGGDEFTVTLEAISHIDDAAHMSEKIIEVVSEPIVLEGKEMVVSTSIGVSLYPDDAVNPEDMCRTADAAMYLSKEQGRNTFRFYTGDIHKQTMDRLSLENSLRRAMGEGELMLHYQPQFELATGAIAGLEALIRWQHPERGFMLPEQFISVAEESALISVIGNWVMRAVCFQARSWIDAGLQLPRIAINVSGRQILYDDVAGQMQSALRDGHLEDGEVKIELEITETVLQTAQSMQRAGNMLQQLRSLGVTIAIDDFGTGYSSLSRLKHLPIDTLKIDQAFVRNIPGDKSDEAITQAIVAMGHSLGLCVVGEGVETADQLDFLRKTDCDMVQGFLLGRPMSADAVAHTMKRSGQL